MPDPRPCLIITRPRAQGGRFAAEAEATCPDRFEILLSPLLQIVAVDAQLPLDGAGALIFTSENGVHQFAARWSVRDLPALCVGARSTAAARSEGLRALSADGAGDDLVTLALRELPPGTRALHLRGRHATGTLAAQLTAGGLCGEERVIYDQVATPLSAPARAALQGARPVLMPLFSPRTAKLLAAELAGGSFPNAVAICLSVAVRRALPDGLFGAIRCCARPNARAMLNAISAPI